MARLQRLINDGTYQDSPHKEIDMERIDEAHENFLEIKRPSNSSKFDVAITKQGALPLRGPQGRVVRRAILGSGAVFQEVRAKKLLETQKVANRRGTRLDRTGGHALPSSQSSRTLKHALGRQADQAESRVASSAQLDESSYEDAWLAKGANAKPESKSMGRLRRMTAAP